MNLLSPTTTWVLAHLGSNNGVYSYYGLNDGMWARDEKLIKVYNSYCRAVKSSMRMSEIRDYTSDGLETLHYHTREILAIIVTPGSLPGNVWLHCYYGAIL